MTSPRVCNWTCWQERTAYLKSQGRCPFCGRGKLVKKKNGRLTSRCVPCSYLARIRATRKYVQRRKKGLCLLCGKVPVRNVTACLPCRRHRAEVNKRRYQRRIAQGLCVYCENKVRPGGHSCEKCFKKKQRQYRRRHRQLTARKVMRERTIVNAIIAKVKAAYPRAYVRKLADRFARGLPDILIIFPRDLDGEFKSYDDHVGILWVETKTKKGRLTALQAAEHDKLRSLGATGLGVLVATDPQTVLARLKEMGAVC